MARDARFALTCLHGNQPWRFGPAGRGPANGDRLRAVHRRPGDSRSTARGLRPLAGVEPGDAGVVAVLTAADLDLPPMPPGMGPADFARPALAREVVRFLGEAVAVVVAATREQALDAAEAVAVEYEPLPVVTDPVAAVEPDAPLLFPDHGSNVAVEAPWKGDPTKIDEAEVVLRARLVNQRVIPAPMEPNTAGMTRWFTRRA